MVPSSILRAASLGTGKQDLLHANDPWTHASEDLGQALDDVDGTWGESLDAAVGPSNMEIANDDPMIAGTRQFKTTLVKQGSGSYRTERSEARVPRNLNQVSAGGGHWKAPQKFWYGFLMRVDQMDTISKGYYCQWHTKAAAGGSPVVALRSYSDGLHAYLESNPDNGGNDYDELVVAQANVIGVTHAYIFEIFWDTRTEAEGSEGIVRLYVDDSSTPAFEWLNKNNNQLAGVGNPAKCPYFKWGLYKSPLKTSGDNGDTYIQNHTNYVVHGENADRQGVLDSLLWNLVSPGGDIIRPNAPTLLDVS